MGKKSKPPKPPDMQPFADMQLEAAKMWEQVARDQLDWAKEQGEWGQGVLEQVLGVQLPQLQFAWENAVKDRERYEQVFQPIEDALVQEFQEYDTPERREQEAAERIADVRTAYEAQRQNAEQRLEGFGIRPDQLRSQAIDLGVRAQEAAQGAFAANQGRESVEQMGRALRGEAINIGRGMPSQVAQSMGIVNQTAGGAMGNVNQTASTNAALYGNAFQAGGMGMQAGTNAAGIVNQGYSNQLDHWGAGQAQTSGMWGGAAGLAGMALGGGFGSALGGALFGAPKHDGGPITQADAPGVPPASDIPITAQEGEYVVPRDVVMRKGTEFFDKLLDKYKDGGEYEQKKAGIPAGGQANG